MEKEFQPTRVQRQGMNLQEIITIEYLARLETYKKWTDDEVKKFYPEFKDLYLTSHDGLGLVEKFQAQAPDEMRKEMAKILAKNIGQIKQNQYLDIAEEHGCDKAEEIMMGRARA